MNIKNDEKICKSQCLIGKCPFGKCIKYNSKNIDTNTSDFIMNILTEHYGIKLYSDSVGYGIAFDLGTTAIAGELYDMSKARQIAVISGVNRQVVYGRDVIARIKYCDDNINGLQQQKSAIITQLNEMIAVLLNEADLKPEEVSKMCISGNTTMLHILKGLSPISMGSYPFEPNSLFGYEIDSKDLGLITNAKCYLPPCISSFVGADIVCGLTALQFNEKNNALFMDIGTNGEIAAVRSGAIYSSATAAGPAFEGAHIEFGMAAAPGAINEISEKNGKLVISTIDECVPIGLTGSGLADAIAVFVKLGYIEVNGKILTYSPNFEEYNGFPALNITNNILLTQKDIRDFQTAKAALCAGILTLKNALNSNVKENSDIKINDTLFLAGGFGNFLNIANAYNIGLIPYHTKTISVGNSSLIGAAQVMMNESMRVLAQKIASECRVIDLAADPYFIEKYVECMSLTYHG